MKHRERIDALVKDLAPELKNLTKKIHANPEIGMKEFKAYEWQVELLKKYGFDLEEGYCDMPTAYRATYKSDKSGPVLATIAEYDCLPKIGHGCGHNLIAMMGIGAGIVLKEFVDMYGGEIRVYGTPGEENAGGKIPMADAGVFDDVDVCMEVHPACHYSDSWNMSAIDGFFIEFFGQPTHAANSPEKGVNALDAMILLFQAIGLLRQQTKEDARIHAIILEGGTAVNVIPDYTKAEICTRSYRAADVHDLSDRVIKAAEGAALATGCTFKMTRPAPMWPDLVSNQTLTDRVAEYITEVVGEEPKRLHGKYKSGSTDLGSVSYRCPTTQPNVKIGDAPDGTIFGMHTPYFAEFAGSDEAIDASIEFIKVIVGTGIDALTEPEFLAKVKEEFENMDKK